MFPQILISSYIYLIFTPVPSLPADQSRAMCVWEPRGNDTTIKTGPRGLKAWIKGCRNHLRNHLSQHPWPCWNTFDINWMIQGIQSGGEGYNHEDGHHQKEKHFRYHLTANQQKGVEPHRENGQIHNQNPVKQWGKRCANWIHVANSISSFTICGQDQEGWIRFWQLFIQTPKNGFQNHHDHQGQSPRAKRTKVQRFWLSSSAFLVEFFSVFGSVKWFSTWITGSLQKITDFSTNKHRFLPWVLHEESTAKSRGVLRPKNPRWTV